MIFLFATKPERVICGSMSKTFPGAHVLLPARSGRPASQQDKEFAAGLAAHFSKARGKGKVEVIIADAGQLERPRGALPGQVIVKSYETILSAGVEPDQKEIHDRQTCDVGRRGRKCVLRRSVG